jgi:hypothetical protein
MPLRAPNPVRPLSPDLKPIYELELTLGNSFSHVLEPAGTECPFAVVMKQPLNFGAIEARLILPPTVERWECDDPHYEQQAGYWCARTRHTVSGPIPDRPVEPRS